MSDSRLLKIQNLENLIHDTTTLLQRDTLLSEIAMTKKSIIKELHTSAITQLKGKDKRWHTYVKQNGQTKELKAPTEQALYEKLWHWYGMDGMTFEALFHEWLEYQKPMTRSMNTIRRHEQRFKKYFSGSSLLHKNVRRIDRLSLESEMNRIVKDHDLTHKEYNQVKSMVSRMLAYAVDKSMIPENLAGRITISVKFRQTARKDSSTQIYQGAEYDAIHRYLQEHWEQTRDPGYLAARFQFLTGLRVGELTALRWTDVDFGTGLLRIASQETDSSYQDPDGTWRSSYRIEPHTKTHQDRYITLVPKALGILRTLPHTGEFLFMRGTERVTSRQVNYILETYASETGCKTRRSHSLRRTFASRCASAGMELETLRKDLGHSSLTTTLGYIYETDSEKGYAIKCSIL